MDNISQNEKLSTIVKALDSKRAEDIRIIEIGDLTIVADYFVIANGTSSTQTKALAEEVEFKMSQLGIEPNRTEGYQGATWVVLDYGEQRARRDVVSILQNGAHATCHHCVTWHRLP